MCDESRSLLLMPPGGQSTDLPRSRRAGGRILDDMTIASEDLDARFMQIMTASARRVAGGTVAPYEEGIRLMGQLVPFLPEVENAGAAYVVWGDLTDGIDGPPAYARGQTPEQIEDLMRQAASEWLALDPRADELRRYFERWRNWPDFAATN